MVQTGLAFNRYIQQPIGVWDPFLQGALVNHSTYGVMEPYNNNGMIALMGADANGNPIQITDFNDMVSFIRNIKEFCFVELEKNNNNTEIFLKSINKKELEDAEVDLVSKINDAVDNAITPLPIGISAIGELLAHSSDQVDSDTIQNIGWLIEALRRQMFALSNLQEVSKSILTSNKGLKGDNGGLMS